MPPPPLPGQSLAKGITLEDEGNEDGQGDEDGAQNVDNETLVGKGRVNVTDFVDHRFAILQVGR